MYHTTTTDSSSAKQITSFMKTTKYYPNEGK